MMRLPGMEFWDITICSVTAWLGRNDDDIARNGVLGRCDFCSLSLATTKRTRTPRSATGLQLPNVTNDLLELSLNTSSQKRRRS
eukprot:5239323-Pyramimonas_sp.AAC.1